MADPYIDNQEILSYDDFAASQITALLVGLDPALDGALTTAATRITAATDAMRAALQKAGQIDVVTYKPADGAADPVADARDVLRRFVSYADSRAGGHAIVKKVLGGEAVSTVLRRRPTKLAGVLGQALETIAQHQAELPEHAQWTADIGAARSAVDDLNKNVRQSRTERRDATPEVAAARAEWLKVYGAAKLIAEGVLRYKDKVALLPEVFDDLAEVHRAPGVSDEPPTAGSTPANPT
jgi:hypothetical protein